MGHVYLLLLLLFIGSLERIDGHAEMQEIEDMDHVQADQIDLIHIVFGTGIMGRRVYSVVVMFYLL